MFLSITAMVLLIALLLKIDNLPMERWKLPIQPNSLIAVFTTVGKTALMVVAASCISQLKWRHLILRPRRIIDIQHFDDASRGPWGATTMIWHLALRARPLIAIGFAVITIVALGIDATAQQVIALPTRETRLSNVSVELGMAEAYDSKGFLPDTMHSNFVWQPNPDLLSVYSGIINSISGTIFQPHLYCPEPVSRCSWDNFTTLGICATYENVTDVAVPKCGNLSFAGDLNCTYTFPGMPAHNNKPYEPYDNTDGTLVITFNSEGLGGDTPPTTLFQSLFTRDLKGIGSFLAIKAKGDGYPLGDEPPPVEVYYSVLHWCAQTFHQTNATPSGLKGTTMTAERLHLYQTIPKSDDGPKTNLDLWKANSTGALYNITQMADTNLPFSLNALLSTKVSHNIYRPDTTTPDTTLALGYALQNRDIKTAIDNIATSLTNQIRSRDPGDNNNASVISGQAFINEPYVHIRWGWMALPLAETLLSAVLLILTIVTTRKQPLLKESLVALLTRQFEGWEVDELNMTGMPTQEKLDKLGESLVAQVEVSEEGRLVFSKRGFEQAKAVTVTARDKV
ncbi:hypothetical protein F4780DRAFT_770094 [Xylariomycetidae sp. FL0641]|nr:hypothetical protein F4780DRAFT_770094 [Xylariomycetidae sp. FL0641]